MVVVMAARASSTKKRMAKNWPMGMLLNTLGSVSKTRLGPLAGLKPKVKTAGKMAMPAKRAMAVSEEAIKKQELIILSSLRTYEP